MDRFYQSLQGPVKVNVGLKEFVDENSEIWHVYETTLGWIV